MISMSVGKSQQEWRPRSPTRRVAIEVWIQRPKFKATVGFAHVKDPYDSEVAPSVCLALYNAFISTSRW